jgi:hypothetical protein
LPQLNAAAALVMLLCAAIAAFLSLQNNTQTFYMVGLEKDYVHESILPPILGTA